MSNVLWLWGYFVFFHVVHSYVLLTTNLEDFNAIAKHIAASPIAGQINKMIRRASNLFSYHAKETPLRARVADDEDSEDEEDDQRRSIETKTVKDSEIRKAKNGRKYSQKHTESNKNTPIKRMNQDEDNFLKQANSRNTSYYLSGINKIFEDM